MRALMEKAFPKQIKALSFHDQAASKSTIEAIDSLIAFFRRVPPTQIVLENLVLIVRPNRPYHDDLSDVTSALDTLSATLAQAPLATLDLAFYNPPNKTSISSFLSVPRPDLLHLSIGEYSSVDFNTLPEETVRSIRELVIYYPPPSLERLVSMERLTVNDPCSGERRNLDVLSTIPKSTAEGMKSVKFHNLGGGFGPKGLDGLHAMCNLESLELRLGSITPEQFEPMFDCITKGGCMKRLTIHTFHGFRTDRFVGFLAKRSDAVSRLKLLDIRAGNIHGDSGSMPEDWTKTTDAEDGDEDDDIGNKEEDNELEDEDKNNDAEDGDESDDFEDEEEIKRSISGRWRAWAREMIKRVLPTGCELILWGEV
ncbi:hypothetical protein HDV00_003117 [Rhizophlyctis rosea]|nr:hypothetical protein HDV00_003117 [Rhizophlyctis rosea]